LTFITRLVKVTTDVIFNERRSSLWTIMEMQGSESALGGCIETAIARQALQFPFWAGGKL